MAISPATSSAAASTAQSNALVALAQAKAANQQALVQGSNDNNKDDNPVLQAPAVKPVVNTSGQAIGTTVNITA